MQEIASPDTSPHAFHRVRNDGETQGIIRNDNLEKGCYIQVMEKGGFVYIMTNKHHTTLYTGVTSELLSRVTEHKEKKHPKSFTAKYNIDKLVYYDGFSSIEEAIAREKQIKGGSRKKKEDLITKMNPQWIDLYDEISKW